AIACAPLYQGIRGGEDRGKTGASGRPTAPRGTAPHGFPCTTRELRARKPCGCALDHPAGDGDTPRALRKNRWRLLHGLGLPNLNSRFILQRVFDFLGLVWKGTRATE